MKALILGVIFAALAAIYMKPADIAVPEAPAIKVVNHKAIELPEDGGKVFTTICIPDKPDAKSKELVSWFVESALRGPLQAGGRVYAVRVCDDFDWQNAVFDSRNPEYSGRPCG